MGARVRVGHCNGKSLTIPCTHLLPSSRPLVHLHKPLPYHVIPSPPSDNNDTLFGDDTLGQGTFGTWHILPSISMVDSVTCLRYVDCSRAPDYIIKGYDFPMQTISCTWR